MTHYLTHLTSRVLNPGDGLQPRLGSRFEPSLQGFSALTPTEAETHLSPESTTIEGVVVAKPVMSESFRPSEHLNAEAEDLRPPSPRPPRSPAPPISVSVSPVVPADADRPPRQFAAPTPPSPEPLLSPPPQSTPPRSPQGRLDRATDPIAPRLAPRPSAPLPSTAESTARTLSGPELTGGDRSLPTPSSISPEHPPVSPPLSPLPRPQGSVMLPAIDQAWSSTARVDHPSEGQPEEQRSKTGQRRSRLNSPQPSPPIQPQNPLPQPGLTGILSAIAPPRGEHSPPLGEPQETSRGLTALGAEAATTRRAAPQTVAPATLLPVPSRADRRAAQTLQPRVEPLPSLPMEMATQPERSTVNISIGRIEVRAVPPRRATPRAARASAAPVTSLSSYLHSGGQR